MPSLPLVLAARATDVSGTPVAAVDAAFGEALSREHPRLSRLVQRLLGYRRLADVEDVLQDVYLAAWRHREQYRADGPLAAWLRRIALHAARNHDRQLRRRQAWQTLWPFGPAAEPPAGADDVGDADAAVRQALQRLRHADREVLVLRYLEAESPSVIAAQLGLSRNALDARLSRARRRLQSALGGELST